MTHNEFLALTVAVALFAGGELARLFVSDKPAYGPEFYSRRDSLFFALSADDLAPDTTLAAGSDSVRADSMSNVRPSDERDAADGRIDINRASLVELTQLPGIGPRLAERIIAYREKHGRFRRASDLQKVSGIGPRKLEAITPLVVVGS